MADNPVPKNNALLQQARALRKNMTPQEAHLWYDYLRYYPVKIYKQRIVGSFIADFYCSKARLVIELDGAPHFDEQGRAYDAERTAIMESYGLLVIRFSDYEVDKYFREVCNRIDRVIKARMTELQEDTLSVSCADSSPEGGA